MALELGLTDQEYRTAMKNLVLDKLIEGAVDEPIDALHTPTQEVTQKVTQRATQKPTQVTIMIYKELGGGVSPKEQPNEQPKEQPKEQPQNNNINNKKTYSLTLARACAASLVPVVAEYICSNNEDAKAAIRAFLDEMSKKQKVWTDEVDFRSHLLDWSLKRWLGVASRLSASNKQQERAERQAQVVETMDGKQSAYDEAKRKLQWLMASADSPRARELVKAWYEQGAWEREPLHAMTMQLMAKQELLQVELQKALGLDVLKKRAG